MWRALRAELAYSRPWLSGGMGIAAGVTFIVTLVFLTVGDDGPPSDAAAGIRSMYFMMAPLIVGFIVQSYRYQERRTRLLLMAALTPRQIASARILLPFVLSAIGVLASALVLGTEALITGRFSVGAVHMVGYVGGLLLMMLMMGLLAQEAVAAHRQRRARSATLGWATFVVGTLVLAALSLAAFFFQGSLTWPGLHLGNLVVAVAATLASASLFGARTDFTK